MAVQKQKGLFSEQFQKISTFLYLLVFLLIVNIVFKLNYRWEGISIIVNIYLYVFSFYVIFVFSLIDIPPLKALYRERYGKWGDFILFILMRVAPFILIYFITVAYTLINYLDKELWPWHPVLELLDGRFSNVVFYSLILLIILKLRRHPRLTIPLFVAGAVLYFLVYQLVYVIDPSGFAISMLKFLQITLALFFLIYEFIMDKFIINRRKIVKCLSIAMALGVFLFSAFTIVHYFIFTHSKYASYPKIRSAQILMKLGYSFPLPEYRDMVLKTANPMLLYDLILYSQSYKQELSLSASDWEKLTLSGRAEIANVIAAYLKVKNIDLPYASIIAFAEKRSKDAGETLLNCQYYIEYAARFYEVNRQDMVMRYFRGNREMKVWVIRVMAESKSKTAVPFLINLLTNVDYRITDESYAALVKITGIDPAKELNAPLYSTDVVMKFNETFRPPRIQN